MKDDLTDPDVEQGQVYSYLRWPVSHISGEFGKYSLLKQPG